jgi:beta-phosphoglucomutase-like phosphatase (HAD superfamily)
MVQAVLFDMDGLMVDTEPIHFLAFRAYTRKFGIDLPESMMPAFVGYSEAENLADIKRAYRIEEPLEEMVAERRAIYLQLISTEPILPFPGFWELTAEARRRGLKQAVVSASAAEQVEIILRRLFEARPDQGRPERYFDAIVTGDDVSQSKPAPDLYLLAAERLGLPPAACLVFEDTPPGVASAVAAGMTAIAVRNRYSQDLDFPGAQVVIDSLLEAPRYLDL